jgi:hypothetical protein
MAISKHKLTANTDRIIGGHGTDLFLATLKNGAPTLNSSDALNGGKGIDTIRATLIDANLAPAMKNIEHGIFTTGDLSGVDLDLKRAAQMTDLTFVQNTDDENTTDISVDNAAHVSSLTVRDTKDGFYELFVDPRVTRDMTVSFDNTRSTTVALTADTHAVFRSIHLDISDTDGGTLTSNSIGTNKLFVNSQGTFENYLDVDPAMNAHSIRNVTVTGSQALDFYSTTHGLEHLRSFDSTGMDANLWAGIGGHQLTRVSGGSHNEVLNLLSIGGSAEAPAKVNLGDGIDGVTLQYAFDAETQHYNGGKDFDTFRFSGAAQDLDKAVKGFEQIYVEDSAGTYEVQGMHLVNFNVLSVAAATTVDQLADKATLVFFEQTSTFFTVNVADAANSTADSLRVLLQDSATLGTQVAGFMAPDLTNLQIDCYTDDHVMYLGSVGSATDAATVRITGAKHLELHASNASTSFIADLVVDNETAGADLSGLADGTQAFVGTGATIAGGDGDDILVGGDGNDHISTGGGDNTVLGSNGADIVTLTENSGLDVLVFNSQGQSSYGSGHDGIANFGTFDGIDVSAIADNVTFAGNFADNNLGAAALSSSHASAFFNTTDHTLYIDLDHSKGLGSDSDMAIELDGVDSLQSSNLIS